MTKTTKITDLSEILVKDCHLNPTISPTSHDLPKDGAKVHYGEKEAVIANCKQLDAFKDCFRKTQAYADLHHDHDETAIFCWHHDEAQFEREDIEAAWQMWQRQQAVVDEYKMVAGALDDQLEREIKNNRELHRKLELASGWEKIAQQNGEDKRRLLAENEELQKRVGAVESTLRAMREKAAAKYQVSFVEEDGGADYWSGQFNAFDAVLHSLGFKDSHDEGADHESN